MHCATRPARASKPEQDARANAVRLALAQFQADRRWMIDLVPPEMLFAVLLEDGDDLADADAAAPALLDPFYGGACARQLGKHRPTLSDGRLKAAHGARRQPPQ